MSLYLNISFAMQSVKVVVLRAMTPGQDVLVQAMKAEVWLHDLLPLGIR
jgi:hypothetical protein